MLSFYYERTWYKKSIYILLYLPSLGTGLMCLSYPSHSGNNLFLINFGIFPFLWRFLKRRPRPPRPRLPASARKLSQKKFYQYIHFNIREKYVKKLTLTYTKPKLTLQLCWSACCTQMLGKYTKYGRIYADTLIE